MSNTILLKRSSAANTVPSTGNLALGELAINTVDGRLFSKIDTGSPAIVDLTKTDLTGDVTGNRVASTGVIATTLSNTGVVAGTYGNAQAIPSFTVDSKGRLTAANTFAIDTAGIANGTSNIAIPTANGNITFSVDGNANVVVFTSAGANVAGYVTASGNITGGNLITVGNAVVGAIKTDNYLYANGNPVDFQQPAGSNTQIQFNDDGDFGASAAFTFDSASNVLTVGGNVDVGDTVLVDSILGTGTNVTITAGSFTSTFDDAGNVSLPGNLSVTANVSATYFLGNGALLTGIDTTLISNGNSNVSIPVANGNVTVSVGGTANVAVFSADGLEIDSDILATGDIIATGNVNAGNVISLGNIEVLGSAQVVANVSAGNFTTGGNAIISGNVNSGNLSTSGTVTATGNISGGNISTGGRVTATGNVTGGNISTGGRVTATGNVTGGNLVSAADVTTVSVTASGNIDAANVNISALTAANTITANNITVSSNVQADGNVVTDSIVNRTGELVIGTTSNDYNIRLAPNGTGVILANSTFIRNLADPSQASDAATKQYVDDAVSAGIHIHTPVDVETAAPLSAVTYANGGNTFTVNETIAGNTVVFTTAANLQVNDQLWFDNSFNGVVGNLAYFVVSTPNTSAAVLTTAYNGVPVSNITSGSGLTESVRVNSGIGATLTATANGAIVVDGVSLSAGNRVMVNDQLNQIENGVYVVTDAGNVTAPFILTRSSDADTYEPQTSDGLDQGSYFYVESGDTGAGASYVKTAPSGPFIFGVANIVFTQFSASQVYQAGVGLTLTGTTFSVNASQPQITEVGNLISLSVAGNADVGNLATAQVAATGNIAAANLVTGGGVFTDTIDATGNISAGNISSSGVVTALATISTLANITATTAATSNVTGALIVAGGVGVSGNIYAGDIYKNGVIVLNADDTIDGGSY